MSDTPRTDAIAMEHLVPASFARQLERELNAMTLRCQAADRTANNALSIRLCDAHGGRGFVSDCVVCHPTGGVGESLETGLIEPEACKQATPTKF